MQLHELKHLIRAAARITNEYEFIVLGSQSILGSLPRPPAECVMSNEADIFPMNAEDKGRSHRRRHWRRFAVRTETYGYYAQGYGLDHRHPAGMAGGTVWYESSPIRPNGRVVLLPGRT